MKFKKGDRAKVIVEHNQFNIGAIVTILQNGSNIPYCKADEITMVKPEYQQYHDAGHNCIPESQLEHINNNTMNDNDKIELTVADVKAAHAKGCSTGKAMVEAMFPKVFKKEETYKLGERFRLDEGCFMSEEYILSQNGDGVSLINLKTGNRWFSPVLVGSESKITESEFKEITYNRQFTKL